MPDDKIMTPLPSNPTISPNTTVSANTKTAVKPVEAPVKPQTLADNVAAPKPRFNAEMPNIPGVGGCPSGEEQQTRTNWGRAAIAVGALLILGSAGAWMMTRTPHSETAPAVPVLQPSPAVADLPALPTTDAAVAHEIGTIEQFAAPWGVKKFTYTNMLTGQQTPAIAIRLPGGNGRTAASYWVILLKAPFGNCALEYVSDTKEISSRFGFSASHPMIADACTNTLYDPTRMGTLPNGSWARGEIVQGSGFRPPLQVEIRIDGDKLISVRSEE
jgi:hypothetical protein